MFAVAEGEVGEGGAAGREAEEGDVTELLAVGEVELSEDRAGGSLHDVSHTEI